MKITFFIRQLNLGGAQRQLVNTAVNFKKKQHDISIVTFYDGGIYDKIVRDEQISIYRLHNKNSILRYIQLIKIFRKIKPDVLISYLAIANLFSIIIKPFIKSTKIIWYLRNAGYDDTGGKIKNRLIFFFNSFLSLFADHILANSNQGVQFYKKKLRVKSKIQLLHNSIDTNKFYFDQKKRVHYRDKINIKKNEILVAAVGRINIHKNLEIFIQVAKEILKIKNNYKFAIVGMDDTLNSYNNSLLTYIKELDLEKSFIIIKSTTQIENIYNATDILLFTSEFQEGFPNVLAEAVSCGVYTVANNVGEAQKILSKHDTLIEENTIDNYFETCINFTVEDNHVKQSRHNWIKNNFGEEIINSKLMGIIETIKKR